MTSDNKSCFLKNVSNEVTLCLKEENDMPVVIHFGQYNSHRACFSLLLTVVEIERIDLVCEVNNTDHHTLLNGVDRLIVRRGQTFTITLHLRPGTHFQNGDNINFIAQTGSSITSILLRLYIMHLQIWTIRYQSSLTPRVKAAPGNATKHDRFNF